MMPFQKNHVIFAQGEPSDGLFFIQEGKVQLSVVSEIGKEATLGILGEADFFEKVVLLASWCACRRQPP
jgi:CRP/FNR family cyclic AMP-dependent transcriptional regulator